MSMRQRFASIAAAVCLGFAPLVYSGSSNVSVWTGTGTNNNWTNRLNWQGGTAPTSGADVTLGSPASQNSITLDTSPVVNSLTITSSYYLYGTNGNGILTIGSGGLTVNNSGSYSYPYGYFNWDTSIALAGSQTWTIGDSSGLGYGDLYIYGNVNGGSTDLLNALVYRSITLAGNNSFSGTVALQNGSQLQVGSDTALGNATLNVNGSATISNMWSDRTLANAVNLNGGNVNLNPNYNSFTFSGPITISNPTDLAVWGPGPVIFSGTVGESGGAQSISKSGDGMLVLNGSVGITGGASVNQGLMVIGSSTAVPATGLLGVYGDGYLGLDLATGVTASQFLSRLDPISYGTIGFDTATPDSPAVISDPIDLSRFTGEMQPRLGSATAAKLSGLITPAAGTYSFGGGGGTLEVASNLTGENSLGLYSPSGQSLALILSGTNGYSGSTRIDNSILRFANSNALPRLGESSISFGDRGYLGLDYTPAASDLINLWSSIGSAGTAILGFDSPDPMNPNTVTISTDTLQSLPSGAFLGTSTNATIGITKGDSSMPSSISFAGVRDGHLTVSSLPSGEYSVTIGLTNDYTEAANSDYTYDSLSRGTFATANSTVTLSGANAYSGGTTLMGGRLELGDSGALGTGALTVNGSSSVLATTVADLTIPNDVSLVSGNLTLDATNSFTLAGAISGYDAITKIGAGNLTLAGANPSFTGSLEVVEGTLNIANDSALSTASLNIDNSSHVNFTSAAPILGALSGGSDTSVNLNNAALSINGNGGGYYDGTIGGTGSIVLNSGGLFLSGNNSYSGGTTVNASSQRLPYSDGAVINSSSLYATTMVAGSDHALGSGTVSMLGGSLYLVNNATLTNPLTFGSGIIGGVGTFAPTGGVVIGDLQVVAPGIPNSYYFNLGSSAVGTLNFGTGLTFASGGTYQWALGDASGVAGTGWDEILVAGTLTITSTPAAPFFLTIAPVSSSIVFNNGQYYSWTIASASTGITGFNPNAIAIDSTAFTELGILGSGQFYLTQTGNDLMLNFTPVPEPSTYALMALGLGVVAMGLRRRKRQAR